MKIIRIINIKWYFVFIISFSTPLIAHSATLLGYWNFDEPNWQTTGSVADSSGSHNGVLKGNVSRIDATSGKAHAGTCSSADFNGGAIDIRYLPINPISYWAWYILHWFYNITQKTTVSFWMYWDGQNSVMPIGWQYHDLWFDNGSFGFNSGKGDIYGISSAGLAKGWHHVVAEFTNYNVTKNKLYIDGVAQSLTQRQGSPSIPDSVVSSYLRLGGWWGTNGYRFSGRLDEVKVYAGALTQAQVNADYLYQHSGACPAGPPPQKPTLVADYTFNDNWSSGQTLKDSTGTADGKVIGNVSKVSSPASGLKPNTCSSGKFSGGAVDINSLPVSTLPGKKTSISFWMKWDGTNSVMPLGWRLHDLWFDSGSFGFNTAGNDIYGISSTGLSGTWHYVTAVFTNKNVYSNKLYIDGVPQVLTLRKGTIFNYNAVVSPQLMLGGWWFNAWYRFHGELDEVKVYTGEITAAMVAANMKAVSSCSCSLGGFAITQPANAIACPSTRSPVTITAICSDGVTVKKDYSGTFNLTTNENSKSLFYGSATGGAAISSKTLTTANAGTTQVYLYHEDENPALKVTATDVATRKSGSAITGTDYRTSGLVATTPSSFICGKSSSLRLTAIGQTGNSAGACSVLTGFAGVKPVKAWYSVNVTPAEVPPVQDAVPTSMVLAGQTISAQSLPAANNLNVTFNAGVANVPISYLDSGQIMSLNFKHDIAPYSGLKALLGTSGSFVVSPSQVSVKVADPVNAKSPACAAGDSTCTPFVKAGRPFRMTSQAQCVNPAKTVAKSYQGIVPISLNLVSPSLASGGVNGSLAVTSAIFGSTNGGTVTTNAQKVNEVGVFSLTATPPAYFGVSIPQSTTGNIGRFTPDHFSVAIAQKGSFKNACSTGIPFTYTGQNFGYTTAPQVDITALNASNITTKNYTLGGFDRLAVTGVVRSFPTSDSIQKGKDGLTRMLINSTPFVGTLTKQGAGVLRYTFASSDLYQYTKNINSEVNPFTGALSINITGVSDSDNIVGTTGIPLKLSPTGPLIRYGRWKMDNTFGPETSGLKMNARAQYLGGGTFVTNTADSCTNLAAVTTTSPVGSPAFSNIAVGGGATNFSFSAPLSMGVGNYQFTAPGAGHTGEVKISVNLNTMPWLQYDWNNNGTLDNPPDASATFGLYRGNDRIIYWREVN